MKNLEKSVVSDFGKEWKKYNQQTLENKELTDLFKNYFSIFPFKKINKNSVGFDMGCGSGRWAKLIAPKVKTLNCIEPSAEAISQAKIFLKDFRNCKFENSDVMKSNLEDNSQDFGYCLGVLHHVPDTYLGLEKCVVKLKKGAPFLLYLYYRFDNKPLWFKFIWFISNILRNLISKFPFKLKLFITKIIAFTIYFPLARLALFFSKLGIKTSNFPLSFYKNSSLYTMQTDSLDRFGTRLEHRFTKIEILNMMKNAGLVNIKFNEKSPYWVAVGEKK